MKAVPLPSARFVVLPELLSLAERETLMAECDALVDAMRERGETVDDDADCVVEPFSQQTVRRRRPD